MSDPHQVTRDFEAALCAYTGAPFAVTTTSCTQAILMALAWFRHTPAMEVDPLIILPKLTYVGVPASVRSAGYKPRFRDIDWQGEYQLAPVPVWDSARRFTSGMYTRTALTNNFALGKKQGPMQCVSFHSSKILADTQGGAILHDNPEADLWLRRARFDGRTEGVPAKDDQVTYPSWHAYMSPDVAARLLWKLQSLPRHNADLPRSDYPDLSQLEAFK